MSRSINKVILIGNLGVDPEVRYTAGGASCVNISIATTDSWRDKHTQHYVDKTEWHQVVFFNNLAEIVAKFLYKGSKVYVEGRLETNKWQDKNGTNHYTTKIIANEMQMLGAKKDIQSNKLPDDEVNATNNIGCQHTGSSQWIAQVDDSDEALPF